MLVEVCKFKYVQAYPNVPICIWFCRNSGNLLSDRYAGRHTLVELEVSPINDAYSICIHGVVVSDPSGNDIET